MSRLLVLSITFTASFLGALPATAQSTSARPSGYAYPHDAPVRHNISAGAYVALGIATTSELLGRQTGLMGEGGFFVEYARHRLRPGVDARLAGEVYGLNFSLWDGGGRSSVLGDQKFFGPRLSYTIRLAHPYVEMLFGHADIQGVQQPSVQDTYGNLDDPQKDFAGFAKYAVAGTDFDVQEHLQVRVEYSVGGVANTQGMLAQNFSTGLVLRFP